MTQKEILEKEGGRGETTPFNAVYLYAEGAFYHAYEWSAWLCCRYVKEFKTIRRESKGDETEHVVFIGLPVGNIESYFPANAWNVTYIGKDIVTAVPGELLPEESDFEALRKDFTNWKNSVPKAPSRKNNASLREAMKNTQSGTPHRMSEIVLSVLSFPVEQKTPMECMAFVTELKQQIAGLL